MKKKGVILLVAIIAVVGVGAFYMSTKGSDKTEGTAQTNTQSNNTTESSSAASATTIDDACKVFSVSQLMTTLGISPLSEGTVPSPASKTKDGLPLVQCEWEQGSGSGADYTLHLDVYNFASNANATNDMDNANVTGGSLTTEVISGVADQALFSRSGSGTPMQALIYWRKGNVVYHLSAVRLDGVDRPAMEAKLKDLVSKNF